MEGVPLLPRFEAFRERIDAEKAVAKAIEEAGEVFPDATGRVYRQSADGHNRDRLRGLPAIGRGIGRAATDGSDPLGALLRKEARAERPRRGR